MKKTQFKKIINNSVTSSIINQEVISNLLHTEIDHNEVSLVEVLSKEEQLKQLLLDESIDVHSILLSLNLIVENSSKILTQSKSSLSKILLDEVYNFSVLPRRKDIIQRLVDECGLTLAGAGTYLQLYKTKNGLVHKN